MPTMKLLAVATGAVLAGMAITPAALAHNSNTASASDHATSGNTHQAWANMDANHDGYISHSEAEAFNKLMFTQADGNHDGRISESEFRSAWNHGHRGELNPVVKAHNDASQTFNRLDANADGQLTPSELTTFRTRMFEETDVDRNGSVEEAEFMSAWNDTSRGHSNANDVRQLWSRMDANHDGQVSPSEADAAQRAMFTRMDANQNGKVTQSEYLASLRDPSDEESESNDGSVTSVTRQDIDRMWNRLDSDDDGRVTRMEADWVNAGQFAQADTNTDGKLSKQELRSAWDESHPGATSERAFAMMWNEADSNDNGQLSQNEVQSYYSQLFRTTDTNDDGKLSRQEYRTAMLRMDNNNVANAND